MEIEKITELFKRQKNIVQHFYAAQAFRTPRL